MRHDSDDERRYLEDTGEYDEDGNRIFVEKNVSRHRENEGCATLGFLTGQLLGEWACRHPLAALIVAIIVGIILYCYLGK